MAQHASRRVTPDCRANTANPKGSAEACDTDKAGASPRIDMHYGKNRPDCSHGNPGAPYPRSHSWLEISAKDYLLKGSLHGGRQNVTTAKLSSPAMGSSCARRAKRSQRSGRSAVLAN